MDNEHTFALFRDSTGAGNTADPACNGSANGAAERIRAALAELNEVCFGPMSRTEANQTLRLLSQAQSVVTSLMCDVGRHVADSEPDTDPAEVLRQGARLPSRESKKMAKVAKQLSGMPKFRERFSTGDITPTHVSALANAVEKVGPEAVEADDSLIAAAEGMPPDSFDRHARRWADRKLIEAGLDPLERQRRAREAKLWVEKETGLGVLMAKLPRPQFEHLRQAIDNHYMHHLRQDSTGGRSPDEVRTPKQRLADVVFELFTNRHAFTGEVISETAGIKAKAGRTGELVGLPIRSPKPLLRPSTTATPDGPTQTTAQVGRSLSGRNGIGYGVGGLSPPGRRGPVGASMPEGIPPTKHTASASTRGRPTSKPAWSRTQGGRDVQRKKRAEAIEQLPTGTTCRHRHRP